MHGWQGRRDRALAPVVTALLAMGVRANHITLLGLACAMAGAVLLLDHPGAASVAVVVHLLLDGLDGPVARAQQTPSSPLLDHVGDAAVAGVIACGASLRFGIPLWIPLVVLITYALSALLVAQSKSSVYWVLRPRIVIYFAIGVDLIWDLGVTLIVLAILVVALSFQAARLLHRRL